MALFTIARYLGEEEEEEVNTTNSPSRTNEILRKIHKDALKRKRQKHKSVDGGDSNDGSHSPFKKPRRESEQNNSFGSSSDETSHKKTKKKKKHVGVEERSVFSGTSETEMDRSRLDDTSGAGELDTSTECMSNVKLSKKKKKHRNIDGTELEISGNSDSLENVNVKKNNVKKRDNEKLSQTQGRSSDGKVVNTTGKVGKLKKKLKAKDTKTKQANQDSSGLDESSNSEQELDLDTSGVDGYMASNESKESRDSESDENMLDETDRSLLESTDPAEQTHAEIGGFTVIGDVKERHTPKLQRVLPDWLAHPSVIQADLTNKNVGLTDIPGLDEDLIQKLTENNITYFFPVQSQVIPVLLDGTQSGFVMGRAGYRPPDICCSAPTGSGKTLAFVLPIIQALKARVTCQVRALAVLPVRDLATQVFKVFQSYAKGTNLKVGLLIGHKTFSNEQQTLVRMGPRGYQSLVDIIVATPGRLVDHINQTPGFNLQHLRFLVIDEADRMMEEVKQDWLIRLEHAVYQGQGWVKGHDPKAPSLSNTVRPMPGPVTAASAGRMEIPLQKLLFSATLSQNPEKLQQLNLFQPKLFTSVVKSLQTPVRKNLDGELEKSMTEVTEGKIEATSKTELVQGEFVGKYTTPAGLSEFFIESVLAEKPLMMLYLLHHRHFRHMLCFTNSVQSTHRLFWLVKLVGGIEVREFSSKLHAVKRTRILKQFESGKVDLLICSDAMARGMDMENVQYVVSYETPPFIKTYIHRVGRTARAGKVGTAVTLLEKKEIFHFKKMMKEVGKKVEELKVPKADLKPLVEAYQSALTKLPAILKSEKRRST